VRTLLLEGAAASTIVQRAAQERSDLIVLGTRGLSDIKGFLLGSTSRKVAALAPCPVLVIKRQPGTMNRVLLAVDDSKHSRRAARYLRSGILPDSATITVLSAVQSPLTDLAARYMPEKEQQALMRPALERAEQLVAGMREELLKEGYAVVTDVQSNHVTDSIIKQAEADRTDLLVIGSRALTKSERLYLGSVSESLLKYAPCSVLIVRGAGTA
jgi:nucleotide-binding universal stress UspA family protein